MTENDFTPVFRVLNDIPSADDAFGPHKQIADTLAKLIAGTNDTPPEDTDHAGYFVALEGAWGSGKSSVINMLRKKLEGLSAPKSEVIIFDAWAHSGDRLRRQFLEILVDQLCKPEFLKDRAYWDDVLKAISGHFKQSTEIRTPVLSKLGVIFGISLLLIPVGGVIASSALGKITLPLELDVALPLSKTGIISIVGLGLCVMPLLIALTAKVASFWSKDKNKHGSIAGMMVNQFGGKTHIEIRTDPDPTTIEFQRTFTNIMAEALNHRDRRLVLVIDNLDRLSSGQALRLWEAMQTFVDKNAHIKTPWQGKLWIIVAYDREQLDHHFKEVRIQTEPARPLTMNEQQRDGLGHFDKVFDLRLNVPLPLLSKWQPYFRNLLEEAFPNENKYTIKKTMRLISTHSNLERTPREIKRLINLAGPIYLQWRGAFDLPLIMHYALRAIQGFDFDDLRNRNIGKTDNLALQIVLGHRYSEKLVAIHNNAPIEQALQFQNIDLVAEGLQKNEPELLKDVQALAADFDTLLEWTVANRVHYNRMQQLFLEASTIEQSDVLVNCDDATVEMVRDTFRQYFSAFHNMINMHIAERHDQNGNDRLREFVENQCNTNSDLHRYLPDTLKLCDSLDSALHIFDLLLEVPIYSEQSHSLKGSKWIEPVKIVVDYINMTEGSELISKLAMQLKNKDFTTVKAFTIKQKSVFDAIGLPFPPDNKS